jgi:glyoxylase-like metal-dependent hydrolase (beta-lactamase superfamily II)
MAETTLRLFEAGTLSLQHQMVYLKGECREITIPIPFFLVEHPEGNLLFDGGLQLEACTDPEGYFGEHILTVMKPRVAEDQHVLAQLEAVGVEPGSIRYVVQSHLHFDHAGAVGHFPEAEFLVHRREHEYAYDPHWFVDGYKRSDFDRPRVRWREVDLGHENPELDLYGDGAVRLIFTPGHSPGLLSMLVELPDTGPVILAGDAADTAAHYHHRAMPGLYVDGAEVVRSIDRLHRLETESGCSLVIFGHDLEQWRTLKLDAPYS